MSDEKIDTQDAAEARERTAWKAPEIRVLDTRDAEAASGTGDDSGVFS